MARTYALASGVASGYKIWPPSGGVWTFQASSATNAGPEYSTDNPLDIRELDKDSRLEGDGSPGTFEPPETPQVVRVRKSTGELFDEDGDTLPVVSTAQFASIAEPAFTVAAKREGTLHAPGYTQTTLISGSDPAALSPWNANPSLIRKWDSWWLSFDNNRSGGTTELAAGQKIALLRSANGTTWTDGGEPFTDAALCNNPRSGAGAIQSNLATAGDGSPLLAMWNVAGVGAFVSKLSSASGKWTNYRIEWAGVTPVLSTSVNFSDPAGAGRTLALSLDGLTDWIPFFPSDPIVLADGRIAAPVVFHSETASADAVPNESAFQRQAKFCAVIYFDAAGNPLYMSERVPLTADVPGYASWEPWLVQVKDGTLRMFIRNLKITGATDAGVLAVSESRDGRAWTPARATEVLTASQRANATRADETRWVAALMDFPAAMPGNQFQGRFNGTLYLSRNGFDDFVPALPFADTDTNCIYPQVRVYDGTAYVVWYRQRSQRNDLMLSVVDLPDDDDVRVYPRRYHEVAGKGPAVVGSTLRFKGIERATAATAPLVHASHGYAAWLTPRSTQGIILDSRGSTAGSVLHVLGLSLGSLSVYHGVTMTPGQPLFIAASVDGTSRIASVWASANGGALTQVDCYLRALKVDTNPADGETITVNGATYTMRNAPSLSNDIKIESTTADTAAAIATRLRTAGMVASTFGVAEVVCGRSDGTDFAATGSAGISVNAGIPDSLMATTLAPRVGFRRSGTSLMPLDADVTRVRTFDSALTLAQVKGAYNDDRTAFGFSALSGASAAPTAANDLTATSTTTDWPDLQDSPQGKASASGDTLTINGEASGSVELPFAGCAVSFTAQLGALPTGTDKYVLATFDTAAHPKRLYIEGAAPTTLKLDGTAVMTIPDPTRPFAVELAVTPDSVIVGRTVQRRTAPGRPRLFLGQAFAEGKLAYSKTTVFDCSKLAVVEYRDRPLDASQASAIVEPTTTNATAALGVKRALETFARWVVGDDGKVYTGDGAGVATEFLSRTAARAWGILGQVKYTVPSSATDVLSWLVDDDTTPRGRLLPDGFEHGPGNASRIDSLKWIGRGLGYRFNTVLEISGILYAAGGLRTKRRGVSSSTGAVASDVYIGVTSTSAARTVTLPDSAHATESSRPVVGQVFEVADESGAAGTNNITIAASGSDTFVGGVTSRVIRSNGGYWRGMWTGSAWKTIGGTTELAGQWRVLRTGYQRLDAQGTGTLAIFENNTTSFGTASSAKAFFPLDPADVGGAGKLKVRISILTNDTAPTSTFTGSLVPISGTPSGAAATVAVAAGSDVSGSTAAVAAPAANTTATVESSEFACPAAGLFALKLLVSTAAMVAGSSAEVRVDLLGRIA